MFWIRRFFGSFSVEYPLLGRWAIHHSNTQIDRKIDLANEDHCGCCSVVDVPNKVTEIEDDYLRPFLF